jgi:hypothetical protein
VTKRWADEGMVEIIDFPDDDFLEATLGNEKVQAVRASWKERAIAAGMSEADADAVVSDISN